ncbi:unnamed protein product [Calicophoron daubneyi]|uniref:Uncharacterized protein n=1 Tax=Calicophoron daubneyi TaxID=300641 RepID=A0AAV2TMZ2_CALDB
MSVSLTLVAMLELVLDTAFILRITIKYYFQPERPNPRFCYQKRVLLYISTEKNYGTEIEFTQRDPNMFTGLMTKQRTNQSWRPMKNKMVISHFTRNQFVLPQHNDDRYLFICIQLKLLLLFLLFQNMSTRNIREQSYCQLPRFDPL